ncbi:hypothetical protein HY256_03440 [Candidatus Sumerlaeota bacterium]|nr:hypothetical protein [Candidatus Sumerlaeota bacterium]
MAACLQISWVLAAVSVVGIAVSHLPEILASPPVQTMIEWAIHWGMRILGGG